jgi:hypothetical protein
VPRLSLVFALLLAGVAPAPAQETGGHASDPAEWEVTGVEGGATVNLRKGPSTGEAVVAELSKGMVLRNLGCTGEGDARWCQVALGEGGVGGWASARYLAPHDAAPEEAADAPDAPAAPDATVAPDPAAGDETAAAHAPGPAAGDAMPPAPAGSVPCSLRGEPAQSCEAMKRQGEDGGIEIIVTFADGFERILDIGSGENGGDGETAVYSPDPTDDVTATRAEGKTVVEVNGVERIELPDALLGR